MKKVLCLTCGLVNLDKFTTYPHCAACGAHLPEKAAPKWRTFWVRPVRPFYWATVVGMGVAVLGVSVGRVVRETRDTSPKLLIVYLQRAPSHRGLVSMRFRLDSTEGNPGETFEAVRVRLPRELERNFEFVELLPRPDTREDASVGQYFSWDTIPRARELRLTLKPRRSGKLQVKATIAARGYEPFDVQRTVSVSPLRTPSLRRTHKEK